MIGKKYFVYTPETNLNVNDDGCLLQSGEVRYSFPTIEKANKFINVFGRNNLPFVVVEKFFCLENVIDVNILNSKNQFEYDKHYQSNKEINYVKKGNGNPPNVKYRWKGKLNSENFKDLKSYYYMKTLLPIIKEQYYDFLVFSGFKVKHFNLDIVAKTYGWVYQLELDIIMNPFIVKSLTIQDMFKTVPMYETILNIRETELNDYCVKDYNSYYNIASCFSIIKSSEKYSYENYEAMKEFYNNCISKDWEIL